MPSDNVFQMKHSFCGIIIEKETEILLDSEVVYDYKKTLVDIEKQLHIRLHSGCDNIYKHNLRLIHPQSSMGTGDAHPQLLAFDSYWERENQLSLRVCP